MRWPRPATKAEIDAVLEHMRDQEQRWHLHMQYVRTRPASRLIDEAYRIIHRFPKGLNS